MSKGSFFGLNKGYYLLSIIIIGLGFFWCSGVGVQANPLIQAFDQSKSAENAAKSSEFLCKGMATELCIPTGAEGYNCSAGIKALIDCMARSEAQNANIITTESWKQFKAEIAKEEAKERRREAIAAAFKNSISMFGRQIAHDTAVWVASGGRGQKPLFITEGWGAYLTNAADVALGDFIDGFGNAFGMDLCQPDFRMRLVIQTSLNYKEARQPRCSFSKIASNWESAIQQASFVVDYQTALTPGENDITYYMIMADRRNSYVADAVKEAEKAADTNDLFTDVKNIAKNILTPGTMVKEALMESFKDSKIGQDVFTGTVFDIIEEFLNTLVSQFLKNLQTGFFSSGGNFGDSGKSLDWPKFPNLFNPNSSPIVTGISGAQERFAKFLEGNYKSGGKYDILVKLTQCDDQVKNNPGPTDCVIDPKFSEIIKQKKYVKDLLKSETGSSDGAIANRTFAPKANRVESLDTVISYRSILILRKYRIVPVGWEIAARIIQESPSDQKFSLADIMSQYNNPDSPFYRLIDPYWVLKAPETYCRRLGYGAQNNLKIEQNNTISRNEYCADEQQCLKEDDNGACLSYGYCQEERNIWRLGKSCDARYASCQSYKSRLGEEASYLANTLDFSNCSAQNAGCRSYATIFNTISKEWNGDILLGNIYRYAPAIIDTLISSGEFKIKEGEFFDPSGRAQIKTGCSKVNCENLTGLCSWLDDTKECKIIIGIDSSCTIPKGGISCTPGRCYTSPNNKVVNGDFNNSESGQDFNASNWSDELSTYNNNNRHYRDASSKLKLVSFNNPARLITYSQKISTEKNKPYEFTFEVEGSINSGAVMLAVYGGDPTLNTFNNVENLLVSRSLYGNYASTTITASFNSGDFEDFYVVVMTYANTNSDLSLDNVSIKELNVNCANSGIKLYNSRAPSNSNSNIYLDRDAQGCPANAEGCSRFIRTNSDILSNTSSIAPNLLYNGGFESGLASWQYLGDSIQIAGDRAKIFYNTTNIDSNYKSVNVQPGEYYAVSYDASQTALGNASIARWEFQIFTNGGEVVNFVDASGEFLNGFFTDCTVTGGQTFTLYNSPASTTLNSNRVSCHFKAPLGASKVAFKIFADQSVREIFVDNLKFEKTNALNPRATAYQAYGQVSAGNEVYLKKAPDYYNCYLSEAGLWPQSILGLQSVLSKRSPECEKFSSVCISSEVGCELYRPVNGDPEISGVVNTLGLCLKECVGYQVYNQAKTNFIASSTFKQFIADKNAKYCSANYAGCDEFTNLDELNQGAEKREYYTQIRACQKNTDDAGNYYTWEGSDVTGYQLKVFRLKKSNINPASPAPCTNLTYNSATDTTCNDPASVPDNMEERTDKGFCLKEDMASNSDCREFYNNQGQVSYKLLSKTISISEDCHPYRRTPTQDNLNKIQSDCEATGGYFNANNECIYMAIPGEGRTCSASANGCRSYKGNQGNNVRKIINNNNFNTGTTTDLLWTDDANTKNGLLISSESTYPGGNSLSNKATNSTLKHPVYLRNNKTYNLSFWAKGEVNGLPLDIKLISASGEVLGTFSNVIAQNDSAFEFSAKLFRDWNRYDLGPIFYTGDNQDAYLKITMPANGTSYHRGYFDNIILKEFSGNVYVVENSWFTPVACDNKYDDPTGSKANCGDPSGRCSLGEMLGCQAYKDRSGNDRYIKSFQSLCRKEAVGCEALIDTHNSASPDYQEFNTGNDLGSNDVDKTIVPADNVVYLVNDKKYACDVSNKGCRALGLPNTDSSDQHPSYQTVYLKVDPDRFDTDLCKHNELWCEEYAGFNSLEYFKNPHGKVLNFKDNKWYKANNSSAVDNSLLSFDQIFGNGNAPGYEKQQPLGPYNVLNEKNNTYSGWVATCAKEQSTCNEYIDPLADNYTPLKPLTQGGATYQLRSHTLYAISGGGYGSVSLADDCGSLEQVNGNPWLLYLKSDEGSCVATFVGASQDFGITKAGVYHVFKNSVDYSSCNGLVDYRDGCILVDDRSQLNYNADSSQRVAYLSYNPKITYQQNIEQQKPVSPSVLLSANLPSTSTSKIVKAKADRECASWLYCNSYQKKDAKDTNQGYGEQDSCLSLASCSYADKNGNCLVFENYSSNPSAITYSTTTKSTANLTGYAYVGTTAGDASLVGYYPFHLMSQVGLAAPVANSGFEDTFGETEQPIGWSSYDGEGDGQKQPAGWDKYKFASVFDPKNAPEGSSYLLLNTFYQVNSEQIDVVSNKEYTLSFMADTMSLEYPNGNPHLYVGVYNSANNYNLGGLVISAGRSWNTYQYTFPTGDAKKIYIKIRNCTSQDANSCFDANNSCGDYNKETTCSISGWSLLDTLEVKPMLKVNNTNKLARSCRIFPAQDAKSCAYWDDNNYYYGQYGYCLLRDPLNRQQCLQWLPIDSLQGEITSEISGYFGRAPLYYCVEKDTVEIKINNIAGGININSSNLGDSVKGLGNFDERGLKLFPFNIDPEYQVMFRYPYIKFFRFIGGITAMVKMSGDWYCVGGPVDAIMHPHGVQVNPGLMICSDGSNKVKIIPILGRQFWDPSDPYSINFKSDLTVYAGGWTSFVGSIYETFANSALAGLINILGLGWDYEKDTWGGWGFLHKGIDLPIPGSPIEIAGFIIAVPWNLINDGLTSTVSQIASVLITIFGGEQNVGSAGVMQMKVVTEDDNSLGTAMADPISDLGGDVFGLGLKVNAVNGEGMIGTVVYGVVSGKFSVDYCKKVVKVVNASGANKAWTNRVNPGSGYVLPDQGSNNGRYFYEDIFDYDKFLMCPDLYQSSDYSPFGSLVEPSNAQDPEAWDSREGASHKQPLYYEPPRTQAFQSPYQARMGELHDINALKKIFAESYGVWEWFNNPDNKSDNHYIKKTTGDWSAPDPADPSSYCPDNRRPYGNNEFCLVRPKIHISGVSVANGNTMKLSFNVKADSNQLPITSYVIYWGDGEMTSYTGVNLRNRQSVEDPFVVYHTYNFEKLKQLCGGGDGTLGSDNRIAPFCSAKVNGDKASVKVGIEVKDNWNAENYISKEFINRLERQTFDFFENDFGDSEIMDIEPETPQDKCNNGNFDPSVGHECMQTEKCCGNDCKWVNSGGSDANGSVCLGGCQGLDVRAPDMHIRNDHHDGCCDVGEDWDNDDMCPLRSGSRFSLKWVGNAGGLLTFGGYFLGNNNGSWAQSEIASGYECDTSKSSNNEDDVNGHCLTEGINANRFSILGSWEHFYFSLPVGDESTPTNMYGDTINGWKIIQTHEKIVDDFKGGVFYGSNGLTGWNTLLDAPGKIIPASFKIRKEAGGSVGTSLRRGDVISLKDATGRGSGSASFHKFLKITNNFEQSLLNPVESAVGDGSDKRGLFQICDTSGKCYGTSGNIYDGLPSYCIPTNP